MRLQRKALIVGIDFYESDYISPLFGCVNDAEEVNKKLKRHYDEEINFDTELKTATNQGSLITRTDLKEAVKELFKDELEIAFFYFSGHGYVESTGGFLVTSDCKYGDDGLSLNELMTIANSSKVKNKIIILDCCHSGITGKLTLNKDLSLLSEGLTILTASGEHEYAIEENGSGVFTNLFIDALGGSAADIVGNVTPGAIYTHIDQSLGLWSDQRPMFKTNVKYFTTLRKTRPSISKEDLRKLTTYFEEKDSKFELDPSFEPERCNEDEKIYPPPVKTNTEAFKILQKYNRLNLLVPVDAPHMWHAAMQSKSCKLTSLGQHYWKLVNKGRI